MTWGPPEEPAPCHHHSLKAQPRLPLRVRLCTGAFLGLLFSRAVTFNVGFRFFQGKTQKAECCPMRATSWDVLEGKAGRETVRCLQGPGAEVAVAPSPAVCICQDPWAPRRQWLLLSVQWAPANSKSTNKCMYTHTKFKSRG